MLTKIASKNYGGTVPLTSAADTHARTYFHWIFLVDAVTWQFRGKTKL